jgi:glycerol uptake facilitator-like aquaporin
LSRQRLDTAAKSTAAEAAARAATLPRRLAAELIGTLLLVATVVGSGIMAERLAGGNDALALLANTLATGAILVVLIAALGPVSGAHFNPAVSLSFLLQRQIGARDAALYAAAQIAGAMLGVVLAHLMFEKPPLEIGVKARATPALWLAEAVATAGLVGTIIGTLRYRPGAVAAAVGLYISAAYWFTSSTSFANPAVTLARGFTVSFSGIALEHVAAFVLVQFAAAMAATPFWRWLFAGPAPR